ncbi:MAG TPA: M23 family metallopeptidase [Acholeplasmataceae bacterium]|nr:M23 family metallopeptidase [Acholeplasmataceae bacterium]
MKIFNNISKEKAQRILFITVLILVFGVFFISLSLLAPGDEKDPIDNNPPGQNDEDDDDDDKDNDEDEITYEFVKAPYSSDVDVIVVRKFWALEKSTEDQEMSLINFGSQYHMSRGMSYAREDDEEFSVIASLSGTVVDVQDSHLYGKTVTIEHTYGIKTEYHSLGTVEVEVGDEVVQGDVIGKSGQCEYDASAGNHVHFKISVNGKYVDPEQLYEKATNTITN